MYPYGGFGWWMAVMMVLGLVFLVVIGYLIYYWLRPRTVYRRIGEDPMEIAKARLARGEITVVEYEEIRKRLEGR